MMEKLEKDNRFELMESQNPKAVINMKEKIS